LPNYLGIKSGFIVSIDDQLSNQLDVVIYDKRYTPPFIDEGRISVIPIETVVGVIEANSKLSSLDEILKRFEKIEKMILTTGMSKSI